jgi:tyrosyl-DNA phosphodiesterase 2
MTLSSKWRDAWVTSSDDPGYTYDAKRNAMLQGNLRQRLDRILIKTTTTANEEAKLKTFMVGTKPIDDLIYEKISRGKMIQLPVLPSDHFGLVTEFSE